MPINKLALFFVLFVLTASSAYGQDVDESDLVLQNAQDILRQIDEEAADEMDLAPQAPTPPSEVKPHVQPIKPVKNRAGLNNGMFELKLPFKSGLTELDEAQRSLVLEQIYLRLQKYEDTHLNVQAYASAEIDNESAVRRAFPEQQTSWTRSLPA